ncbi:MAG: type 4a pilus biogenesis protein PilO [Dehalococcoidia bacterium]|nr:type 4a pilus biogenesis protein PilO [Dehalococcoidia bacterium]
MGRQIALSTLTFCTVLFLVLSFFHWSWYRRDEAAQLTIVSQVAEMRRALAGLPTPEGDLKKELALARERIERVKQALPPDTDSTEIVKRLLELSNQHMLLMAPLLVDAPGTMEVGKHRYGALSLSITVRGYYRNLLDFIKALDDTDQAVAIESLTVTRATASDTATISEGEFPVTAVIDVVVYSRVQNSKAFQGGPPG